jgi:outer membrane lipoprotein SlyB
MHGPIFATGRRVQRKPDPRLSPLVVGAAASIIVASLLAAGAATGLIPGARSTGADPLSASATQGAPHASPAEGAKLAVQQAPCATCGIVEGVRPMEVRGEGTGVGVVTDGVVGGVIGNQFGHGTGRTALTLLGAAGGALAGHEAEKNVRARTVHRVTVRMDDGSYRTFSQATPARPGDRVRVADGALVPSDAPLAGVNATR